MWTRYRRWKHLLAPLLIALALAFMKLSPEASLLWYGGMSIALCMGVAYIAEEIVWMSKRGGRPCAGCGQMVAMTSFRLQTTCPHCQQALS